MFKKKAQIVDDVIAQLLRRQGLETPLLQLRLLQSWNEVAGELVAKYTREKFISNQTLHVKIVNPAVKNDLLMRRTALIQQLNLAAGGSFVIADIHIY